MIGLNVFKDDKETILMGDFNKNLLPSNVDREWLNFTLTLGLTQLVSKCYFNLGSHTVSF